MNKLSYVLIMVSVLFLISCEHKELYYDHSYTSDVRVVFDWKNVPEASPETMRLYLFPLDGGKALLYEFNNGHGGDISIPAGHYKALCVNSDTESVLYRNIDAFDTFEAYAPDGILNVKSFFVPRAEGTADERIAKSPDCLYSASLDDVTIEFSKENQVVTFFPKLSVCRYRVEIKNVSNLKYVSSDGISGSLSGMSGGLLVGRNKLTTDLVTVPFEVVSVGGSVLTADFLTFGQVNSGQFPHKLVIYAIMFDGSKNYYTFDVSRQVHEAANPYDVHIILDGLSLPKPLVNGSGFHPSVDEWQNIEVNIPM